VFLVRHVETGELHAAKRIPRLTRLTWDGLQVAPKAASLVREVSSLVKLQGRHHCVKLIGLLEGHQNITLVSKFAFLFYFEQMSLS
jgi:hypothetical protein